MKKPTLEVTLTIRYVMDQYGLYFVTLLGHGQKIACQRGFFLKHSGANERGVLGTIDISPRQADALGFVLPLEEAAIA
jgi:hypothetical protein